MPMTPMSPRLCHRCRFPNDGEGLLCSVCSAVGAIARQAGSTSPGALWLDDLHVPAPPTAAPPSPPEPPEADRRARAKAERRAHVRRLRLQAVRGEGQPAAASSEVLVLDGDPTARAALAVLLQALGFEVVAAAALDDLPAGWPRRPITAAFVDAGTPGAGEHDAGERDGTALCGRLRAAGWLDRQAASALVLTALRLPPADRVRALLAGCDAVLDKPATRGAVARVLDRLGVVLPADRRCL